MYDDYFIWVSNIAYEWAYILSGFDSDTSQHRIKVPKGKHLNKNHIYDVLFPHSDTSNEIEESDKLTVSEITDIESLFLNKNYIKFSPGALNRFTCGINPHDKDMIDWRFIGYKKAEKTPSLKDLALFSLTIISPEKIVELKNDSNLLEYILSRVTFAGKTLKESDKSTISKARGIKKAYKIETIDDLINPTLTQHIFEVAIHK